MCVSPVIPFKNEMAMELLEKGRVRFWTQVEKCTSACQVEYVFNDVMLTQGKVGIVLKNNLTRLLLSFRPLCPLLTTHGSGFLASRNTQ